MSGLHVSTVVFQLTAVAALVALNGFFVAAEFAVVKVRDTQLQALVEKGHRRAGLARQIVGNLDAALSATQLGITIASLGLGWVGKPAFASLLAPVLRRLQVDADQADWIGFAVGFTVITVLHIVAGELAPKSLAIQKPLPTALWVAAPLQWFYKLCHPVIWLLNHAAFWVLRRFGLDPISESRLAHSEEEIRLILAERSVETDGASFSQAIALNAFDIRQLRVREVMRPRKEIVTFNTQSSFRDCLLVAHSSQFSRFPLCESGDLDRTLGVVHYKDLTSLTSSFKRGRDLAVLARKILFVPETARLDKLLKHFLKNRQHFALVVNEFGETVGMATLEDVLESLLGVMGDEFDRPQHTPCQTGKGWELSGAFPLRRLSELVGCSLEISSQITTLSGWITQRLGRFPRFGDEVRLSDWTFYVQAVEDNLVARVRLEPTVGDFAAEP